GSGERPIPSLPGSPSSCRWTLTLKPALLSVSLADVSSSLVTSGTVDSFGPFETLSVIVELGAAVPVGCWSMTVSFGWLLSTFLRATAKPAFCSVALAWSNRRPTTYGTPTGFGPLDTLICTLEPLSTIVPACGNCPV